MPVSSDELAIANLQRGFLERLPERVKDLIDAGGRQDWAAIRVFAHQMAGAAGSYGYPEIGNVAKALENQVEGVPNPGAVERTIHVFAGLCGAARLRGLDFTH